MKLTTLFGKTVLILAVLSYQAGDAQTSPAPGGARQNEWKETAVKAYYNAYVKKDWNSLQRILADGFTFSSPIDNHISLKDYKEKCWPNCYKIKRFDLVKLVVNGDEAFATYNGWTTEGKLFRNTEYFTFKDGKIKSDECFFGPGVNYPNSGK